MGGLLIRWKRRTHTSQNTEKHVRIWLFGHSIARSSTETDRRTVIYTFSKSSTNSLQFCHLNYVDPTYIDWEIDIARYGCLGAWSVGGEKHNNTKMGKRGGADQYLWISISPSILVRFPRSNHQSKARIIIWKIVVVVYQSVRKRRTYTCRNTEK